MVGLLGKFLKRSGKDREDTQSEQVSELEASMAFFRWHCGYGNTDIRPGNVIVGIVADPMRTEDVPSLNAYIIGIASRDGGFMTPAVTRRFPRGDDLITKGALVLWLCEQYHDQSGDAMETHGQDRRGGWVGKIIAEIEPVHERTDGSYRVVKDFALQGS